LLRKLDAAAVLAAPSLAPRLDVRDLAQILGHHLGAQLPKLLRAVVLRPYEGTHRDASIKQQLGRTAARRTRPTARQ